MKSAFALILLSVFGLLAALLAQEALLQVLSLAGVVLGLVLLGRAGLRRRQPWAILDGSNVMHWRDGTPDIAPVAEVITNLTTKGYAVGVVFDANAGYRLFGRYCDDAALAKQLNLRRDRVWVVPKGTPADPVILSAARDLNAIVITNDRYRDWAAEHPEATAPGRLIRGGYRKGALWLKLDEDSRDRAS